MKYTEEQLLDLSKKQDLDIFNYCDIEGRASTTFNVAGTISDCNKAIEDIKTEFNDLDDEIDFGFAGEYDELVSDYNIGLFSVGFGVEDGMTWNELIAGIKSFVDYLKGFSTAYGLYYSEPTTDEDINNYIELDDFKSFKQLADYNFELVKAINKFEDLI
ncbi:hypothetical protein [Lactobacillus mulieris]|uniref:hypothetical protein n=1 Tax=Lactobacillus mulieris TaxID=2508708 RepID=UPI00084E7E1B|nr:hypothetical protein [Lactobacillus mulieris]OEH66115.1 hypothetical protein BFX48_01975 [Lactobacillus jensenii]